MRRTSYCFLVLLLLLPVLPAGAYATDDTLLMGVFPRRPAEVTKKLFAPLAEHLSRVLGRRVELEVPLDFPAFTARLAGGEYDLVHLNQFHYVANAGKGYRVIVRNVENGSDKIAAAIVTHKKGRIHRLSDLRGKRVVFGGGRSAMVSYVMAADLLLEDGLQPGDYIEQFAGTPPAAILALAYHQGAAAAIGEPALSMPMVRERIDPDDIRVLARSRPLAHLPWAVGPGVSEDLANTITRALLDLRYSDSGREALAAARIDVLVRARDHDYNPHRRLIRRVLGETY